MHIPSGQSLSLAGSARAGFFSSPGVTVAFMLLGASTLVGCRAPLANAGPAPKPCMSPVATALTLDQTPIEPLASISRRATAMIFMAVECPICNRYAPEIQRLAARFETAGVDFWLVYPNADESPEVVRKHVEDYQLTALSKRVIRDPQHVLVQRTGARVTPEVVVYRPGGEQVYRGRIDDRFPALGLDRREPTRRDLEQVLSAILDSRPIPTSGEPAVGCYIPPRP